jgi:hypothetical protein
MNRGWFLCLLVVVLLVGSGCKSKADTNTAIRDAVVKHIAAMNGLNVNNMTVTVTQANVHGDAADANVEIRARNSDPSVPPMQFVYQMQRQGDEWVVVKGQATSGMEHPTPGEMSQGNLPPGHPSTNGASGQTLTDHPDFNSILNAAQPQGQQPAAQQQPSGSKQNSPTPSKP